MKILVQRNIFYMSGILIIVLLDFYYKLPYYTNLFHLIKDACIQNKKKTSTFAPNLVSTYKCINIIVFVKFIWHKEEIEVTFEMTA